jgi:hypothetical protein
VKGVNTITFNTVTMCDIVEYYLRTVLMKDRMIEVCSISKTPDGYDVRFEEKKAGKS